MITELTGQDIKDLAKSVFQRKRNRYEIRTADTFFVITFSHKVTVDEIGQFFTSLLYAFGLRFSAHVTMIRDNSQKVSLLIRKKVVIDDTLPGKE